VTSANHSFRAILALASLLLAAAAGAQSEYLRITEDAAGSPAALQTPIIAFESADREPRGLQVDLVGAVHMADASYYSALNERFADYDAVLYELVAPEGARPQPGIEPDNLISFTQASMTRMLGLTYQLDEIDYLRPNFVHADLTPEALEQSMSERGESVLGYVFRMVAAAGQGDIPETTRSVSGLSLLAMFFAPDRERLLKIEFAHSMLDVEWITNVIEGNQGSSLIGERNARAIAVLDERIGLGDRHIAIFYGVGHLPDLASRLQSEFGLVERDVTWLDAWDLGTAATE
jgi:hypothetical protein